MQKKQLVRRLGTGAAAVMLILSMAACRSTTGSESNSEGNDTYDFMKGKTITIATPYEDRVAVAGVGDGDKVLKRIDEIEKKYGVTIEQITKSASEYWDGMVTTAMSGTPHGDIMFSFPWMTCDWVKGGIIRDVAPLAKELGIDFYDGTWNRTPIDDNTYGNAIYGFNRERREIQGSIVYNKKMFEAAQLEDPNELIASGKKWDFDTFAEYARKLTKKDASGTVTQWGFYGGTQTLSSMIIANGGQVVDTSSGAPKVTLDSPAALEAMNVFNDMLNVDQTFNFSYTWEEANQALAGGTLAMIQTEEWVIEYLRDYVNEKGLSADYALTYFPVGPNGEDYIDPSFGGTSMFIPQSISEDEAKAALKVYAELYAPEEGVTQEEYYRNYGEALFADETSVEVYMDILVNDKAKSYGVARAGINEAYGDFVTFLIDGLGTPQSLVQENLPGLQAAVDESSLAYALKEQAK